MNDKPVLPTAEADLLDEIDRLLADARLQNNPLYQPLQQLREHCEGQRQRLERLVRISDGYHSMSRSRSQTLEARYDRELRRIQKIMRISDGYQNNLREMSEALREAALHDPLTSLVNRRYLMQRLEEETARANRGSSGYTLGILDVDFFKAVNDQYGHDVGDQVLADIAATIQSTLRQGDICGRWGGEEFLIILPDTTADQALLVVERLRLRIHDVSTPDGMQGVSASIGFTPYRPGEHFSATVKRADDGLLEAKQIGRDRSILV